MNDLKGKMYEEEVKLFRALRKIWRYTCNVEKAIGHIDKIIKKGVFVKKFVPLNKIEKWNVINSRLKNAVIYEKKEKKIIYYFEEIFKDLETHLEGCKYKKVLKVEKNLMYKKTAVISKAIDILRKICDEFIQKTNKKEKLSDEKYEIFKDMYIKLSETSAEIKKIILSIEAIDKKLEGMTKNMERYKDGKMGEIFFRNKVDKKYTNEEIERVLKN
jgi:hypothetical protein